MDMMLGCLDNLYKSYGFKMFTRGLYNVNLFGVRAANRAPNKFNDIIGVAFRTDVGFFTCAFPATTDPGSNGLAEKMGNPKGTALLPLSTLVGSGQYKYKLGEHKGYTALVQAAPFKVVRDNNRDSRLLTYEDEQRLLSAGSTDTGYHGINIHHSGEGVTAEVNGWSLGCQVLQSSFDWDKLMAILYYSARKYGPKFTYTLFAEEDLSDTLYTSIDGLYRSLNSK